MLHGGSLSGSCLWLNKWLMRTVTERWKNWRDRESKRWEYKETHRFTLIQREGCCSARPGTLDFRISYGLAPLDTTLPVLWSQTNALVPCVPTSTPRNKGPPINFTYPWAPLKKESKLLSTKWWYFCSWLQKDERKGLSFALVSC